VSKDLVKIITPLADHPVLCRFYSSDAPTFAQVFCEREYQPLDDLPDVSLVVDCGANVGYSSVYFLSRFPRARVVAVEPDAGNFAILRENLAPYGDRAVAVRAGVWSHECSLGIVAAPYRDGREWTRQVEEVGPDHPGALPGLDLGTLLDRYGFGGERVSILKVDVEGAEGVIFGSNYDHWLGRVDTIAIELHDDSAFGDCSGVFHRAIEGRGYDVSGSGELTICRRPALAVR
jgi:FkbM family methyltransferase